MRKITSLLILFLLGCMGGEDGSGEHPIAEGVYEDQSYKTKPLIGRTQLDIRRDGTLEMTSYYGGCMDLEGSGKWRVSDSYIYFTDATRRTRPKCDTAFGGYESLPDEKARIRNITDTSFQTFDEPDEISPGEWIHWKRL